MQQQSKCTQNYQKTKKNDFLSVSLVYFEQILHYVLQRVNICSKGTTQCTECVQG